MSVEEIRQLELLSKQMEPDSTAFKQWNQAMLNYSEQFLSAIENIPVYQPNQDDISLLDELPIPDQGRSFQELLPVIEKAVDRIGINPAAPGHMGYVPGGGVVPTAMGDYLAAITNRYAGITYANAGAVHMENLMLDWMADMVGYPSSAVGNLASGGSIATLTAIVSARDHHGITPENIRQHVIYATEQAHHCILKAIRIAGLDFAPLRHIPMLPNFKMDVVALEQQIEEDKSDDLYPFMIIGSVGSTDVGVIDPLDQLADIAERHDCWLHLDGAYGGFFALLEELKPALQGIERSDSIVIDPHKGLFLSYGTGAVIVKNAEAVYRSHHYFANYMQDAFTEDQLRNPADLSPELTKHFRGMRMWLSLQLIGLTPFRACLREKLLLTQYFYEEVQKLGFTVGPIPELSVCIFRWIPATGDANKFNRKLVQYLQQGGEIFLSSTSIDGIFWPRICIMVFRTHLEHVDKLLKLLGEFVHGNPNKS